jgi:hypothetical protein
MRNPQSITHYSGATTNMRPNLGQPSNTMHHHAESECQHFRFDEWIKIKASSLEHSDNSS